MPDAKTLEAIRQLYQVKPSPNLGQRTPDAPVGDFLRHVAKVRAAREKAGEPNPPLPSTVSETKNNG